MASIPLRILLLEDRPDDAELMVHELRAAGYDPRWVRVEDEAGFRAHLSPNLDLVLADYQQPDFDAMRALRILHQERLDIPFIIVSGAIGEEVAVAAVREGAADYVLKDRLARLGTAVQNSLEQTRLRRQERKAREDLEDLVNSTDGVLWEQALPDRRLTFVSQKIERLLGYPLQRWLDEPGFWPARIHPADRDAMAKFTEDLIARRASGEAQYRMVAADGRLIWVRDQVRVTVENDQPTRLRGVMIDISILKRTEEFTRLMAVVADSANRASSIGEAMQVGVDEVCARVGWSVGHAWMVAVDQASPALESTAIWHLDDPMRFAPFQQATERMSLNPGLGLLSEAVASRQLAWFPELRRKSGFQRVEVAELVGLRSGIALPVPVGVEVAAVLEFYSPLAIDPDAELRQSLEHVALQLGRVIERSRAQRALEHLAAYDSLTNLPNRILLRDRLEQAILAARRNAGSTALLLLDIDNFKEVNDTFGHHMGDELLRQVGPRLRERLRASDTVARLGGDEFAILLPDTAVTDAVRIAVTLLEVHRPMVVEGQALDVGASIGIAVYPDHGTDPDVLLQRADVAMYLAKHSGNTYAVYSPDKDPYDVTRLTLMADLRQAVERRDISIAYQPKINLASGQLVGLEALARWKHPEHGWVPPSEFIPLTERMGLIKALTNCVLDLVLSRCRAWQDARIAVPIAVNLSMRNLLDPDFSNSVTERLTASGVDPRLLKLEITETAVMGEPARAMATMTRLCQLGIGFAVDDFGTGYSSLAYLQRLPVEQIKIDRSFVGQMVTDPGSAAIVRATIDLGHSLGLEVVAEGVEDMATYELLTTYKCETAQGYLISRPLPAEAVEHWLRNPVWRPEVHSEISAA